MPIVTAPALPVTEVERVALRRMASSTVLAHRQVVQARGLLLAADGVSNQEIARQCGVDSDAVRRWRARFALTGVDGVGVIAKGRGRKASLPEGTVAEIVRVTCHETPPDTSTHWTTRSLAKRFGVGKDTIAQVWSDHQLTPWKVDTFKVSTDPLFEEKTQCQAMDRTQPSLPMVPGRAGTMTHDYKRNGTTDLFAAMNVATGEVLTHCQKGHTGTDVLRFFKQIDASVPGDWPSTSSSTTSPPIRPRDRQVARAPRPTALAPALHSDVQLVDQPHRTLVQGAHRPAPAPRDIHQRRRARRCNPALDQPLEPGPHAVHLEGNRSRHHRKGPARPRNTEPPDQFKDRPLAVCDELEALVTGDAPVPPRHLLTVRPVESAVSTMVK